MRVYLIYLLFKGSHLSEHCTDESRADALTDRLVTVNTSWDRVCEQATTWQTNLQTALLEVSSYTTQLKNVSITWDNFATLVIKLY